MQRPTPRARRAAAAVGAVALLGALWWVLRAPTIERHAVATPPAIDIDPPAMRARREAAIALAMMPDDPWTFAESLAASAPTAAGPARQDCGIEGRPAFDDATDRAVQATGASSSYAGAQARIDAVLRTSPDPFDRAVADWLDVGNMRSTSGRDEAVVQQAVASTDARIYALGYGLCHATRAAMPSCRSISLERWLELDADNGVPWLAMLDQARVRSDAEGLKAALAHLATAGRFDTYRRSAAGAVARRAPGTAQELAAIHDLAVRAEAEEDLLPAPASATLMSLCRDQAGGDPALAQTCRAISDAIYAHSDSLAGESLGGALLLEATGDESRRDSILAERALAASHWSPATGLSPCRDLRDALDKLVRVSQIGEVEALREQMRRFVPP